MARLSQVEGCANVVRVQAWNQGSWAAVGIEAKTILRQAEAIRAEMSELWHELAAIE